MPSIWENVLGFLARMNMKLDLDRDDRYKLYESVLRAVQDKDVQHKQWYLRRVAEVLEIDVRALNVEEGVEPQ